MDYYYFTYITGTNANTDNSSGLKKKMGRMRMEMSCCPTTWTEWVETLQKIILESRTGKENMIKNLKESKTDTVKTFNVINHQEVD